MKKQIYFLFLWLLFQAIDASAQSLTIAGPSTPIQMCGSQTYTLSLSTGNLNGNVAITTPEASITLTGPTLISASNNVYTFSATGASITFTVNVGCHFTDNFTSANSAVVTRVNSIVYTPTGGSAISTTQNYGITFFYLLHQTNSTFNSNLTATQKFGSTFTRSFEIYNSGPMSYSGPIDITDNQSGSTIQINSIEIFLLDKTTNLPVQIPIISHTNTLNYTLGQTYKLDNNHSLIVVETLTVNACLDQASSSTINVRYGCDNQTLCHDAGTTLPGITVSRDPGVHEITVSRLLPTTLNERNCPGTVTHFSFEIKNTGNIDLKQVEITLDKHSAVSYYNINSSSINIQSNGIPYTEEGNPLIGPIPGCLNHPIANHKIKIDLNVGEKVIVDFDMTYCCPPHTGDFNDTKYFDTWHLYVIAEDECHNQMLLNGPSNLHVIGGNPYPYTAGWMIATTPWLKVETNFEPTVTDMTDWDGQPTCDLSAQEEFELEYKKISEQGEFFFCPTPTAAPSGEIYIDFILEHGITLEPNTSTDIFLTDGNITLNYTGAVVTTTGIISPAGNPATNYQIRFPISSSNYINYNAFKSFFESSALHFKMSPCCPNDNSTPNYWIRTYLNRIINNIPCDPTCMIPLSENTSFILVHCPGCTTPGIIVTGTNVTRQTLGYVDSDNDGIADDPATLLTTTSPYPIKTTRSVTGDVIKVHSSSTFWGGTSGTLAIPGFTLAQWNAVFNPIHYADYLHLEQKIPHSNSNELAFSFVNGTVTLKRLSGISCLAGSPTTVTIPISSSQLNHLNDDYCMIVPASLFDPCIHFEAGDEFDIDIDFQICGNFVPAYKTLLPDPSKAKEEIEVITHMYISANEAGACNLWGLVPVAQDYLESGEIKFPSNAGSYAFDQVIFNCENSGGRHYFYATEYLNIVDWKANGNTSCTKTLSNRAITRMGGGANNIFPFEVRPPSIMDRIKIDVPIGYSLDSYLDNSQKTQSIFPYYYINPQTNIKQTLYYQVNSNNDMPPLPYLGGNPFYAPAGGNFTLAGNYDLVTETVTFPQSPVTTVINSNSDKMFIGDEYLEQETSFVLKPDCSILNQDSSSFTMQTLQNLFTVNNCSPATLVQTGLGEIHFVQSGVIYPLHNPNPTLVLDDQSSPVQAVGHEQTWTLTFKNTHNEFPAEFPYIYIPFDPHLTFNNATDINGLPIAVQTIGSDHYIQLPGPIAPNTPYQVKISMSYTCYIPNQLYPLDIKYGWNCNEYPTDITQVCNSATKTITLFENGSEIIALSNTISNTGSTIPATTYSRCESYDVTSVFKNIHNGGMFDLEFTIPLPNGVIPDPSQQIGNNMYSATISLNGQASVSCTLEYVSPNNYKIDLTGTSFDILWGSDGWHGLLELKYKILVECSYLGEAISIKGKGVNYCGNATAESGIPAQNWTYSGTDVCTTACCSAGASFSITSKPTCGKFSFEYTGTVTPSGQSVEYVWNFDATSASGTTTTTSNPLITHTYNNNGTYTVSLTVNVMSGNTILCTNTTTQVVDVTCHCQRVHAHFEANPIDGGCAWEFKDASTSEEEGTLTYHWEVNSEPLYVYDGGPIFRFEFPQDGIYTVYEYVTLTRRDGTTCQSVYAYDLNVTHCIQNCNIPNNITLVNDCRQLSLYAPAMWCGQETESQIVWTVNGVDYIQDSDNPILFDINQSDYNICLSYICRSRRGDELCNIRFCYAITITSDCQLYIDGNSITDPIVAHRNANLNSRADKQFDVVPNPSNGSRYELKVPAAIASDEKYTVTIFSATGVIEFTREFTGNTSRQITPQLSEGVHTIIISGKDFSTEKKLIVVQ